MENKNFWYYIGHAGLASMICTFVSVISYMQETDFTNWSVLFAAWFIGFIPAALCVACFNAKPLIGGEKRANEIIAGLCGTLVPLLALICGKIAYVQMIA